MSDRHVTEELSAYIDGEAPVPERIARHLQFCEECARHHMQLLRLSADLKALPRPASRPEFVGRVMARIEEDRRPAPRWLWTLGAPRLALAALLLVAAGAGVYVWRASQPTPYHALVADSAVWVDEQRVVSQFEQLLEEGADLDWLAGMDQDMGEDAEPVEASYDAVLGLLADASLDTASDGTAYVEEDLFSMIDGLDQEEAAILRDLLYEYISQYDNRG